MTKCPNCNTECASSFCSKCGGRMPPESTEVSSPLADIIKRAMNRKSSGAISEARAKIEKRMQGASDEILVVCDLSGSMDDFIGNGGTSKYEHLKIALNDIRRSYSKVRVILFSSGAEEWKGGTIPQPNGGTNLAGALAFARKWKPKKTIIISDGVPDNEIAAQQEADAITGEVDTIYCGPDGHPAIQFLRSLAHSTGGTNLNWDGYRSELAANIRGLLTA